MFIQVFDMMFFLAETLKALNAEEASDKHLRGTFGAKWNRTKSEELTSSFKEQGDKYQVCFYKAWIIRYGKSNNKIFLQIFLKKPNQNHASCIELHGMKKAKVEITTVYLLFGAVFQ